MPTPISHCWPQTSRGPTTSFWAHWPGSRGVLSRRLDSERTSESEWHRLGRALHMSEVAGAAGVEQGAIQVVEFGRTAISVNGVEVQPRLRKSYELLAYLANGNRGLVRKTEVMEALFEGRCDEAAAPYLRQAVLRLRKAIPELLEPESGRAMRLSDSVHVTTESERVVGLLTGLGRACADTSACSDCCRRSRSWIAASTCRAYRPSGRRTPRPDRDARPRREVRGCRDRLHPGPLRARRAARRHEALGRPVQGDSVASPECARRMPWVTTTGSPASSVLPTLLRDRGTTRPGPRWTSSRTFAGSTAGFVKGIWALFTPRGRAFRRARAVRPSKRSDERPEREVGGPWPRTGSSSPAGCRQTVLATRRCRRLRCCVETAGSWPSARARTGPMCRPERPSRRSTPRGAR